MKMSFLLLAALIILGVSVSAQFPYALASVPDSIKKNANVVYHLENYELTVDGTDRCTLDIHKVYTVKNEEGRRELFFQEYVTKFVSIDDVEIKVYDATGKQTRKLKKKDLNTQSVGDGLVEDGFVLYYYIPDESYPVTVDISYEMHVKSTLYIPAFRFVDSKQGVVEANYVAKVLPDIGLRYKAKNIACEPQVSDEGKYKVYRWSVKNLAPVNYDEDGMADEDRAPHVVMAPVKFSHYGFDGDLTSWKSFGQWLRDLYNNLDELTPERQQFFRQMVNDAPDPKEKIHRIYQYMQENFRYVSIQLGIGGLRPFPADFTDKKKYGDCKGLSNYMKAALKSVGIRSHVAIINSGFNSEPVDAGFPANEFNHAILCVPGNSDTTWLECTSSTAAFGELGTSTENRNALLVTEEGGVLVPTPRSRASSNRLSIVTRTDLKDDLSGFTTSSFDAAGAYRELMAEILKEKRDEQKTDLVSYFGARQPDDFQFSKIDAGNKTELKMIIGKMPDFSAGNKLFITPRIYRLWPLKLPKAENRTSDFYFGCPYEKTDTAILKLPEGLSPDVLPEAKSLSCSFASYQSKYWYDEKERSVYTATTIVLNTHKIPASGYSTIKKFFEDVSQDASQKIVVIKKETSLKGF